MIAFRNAALRALLRLGRPSRAANLRVLEGRGEHLDTLVIRDATARDLSDLVDLHVETWNATYPLVRRKPTHAIREHQWREAFAHTDGSWFAFVVERQDSALVGFAKGIRSGHPEFVGELSKIYLRREYQRLGVGSRLIAHVASRFLDQGVTSMILFADPANPSCAFFEALGAEKVLDDNGRFHGAYGWRHLHELTAQRPES